MIEQAFEVATEFKFDVGEAVFNADALRGSVDELSQAASGALEKLNYLAGGLVAHLGLGSGGLLSALTRAVELSEEFNTGSMGFVNSISSNMNVLSGHVVSFNDKLESSAMIMTRIGNEADKLGLSGAQMSQITQLYAGPLSQRKKLGEDYSGGISLAKNTMIGAEAMGINANVLSEGIARALSPGQTLGGKPFERLVNTQAFRSAGVIHPAQLANMQQDKKMDLLITAMSELGNNAGYLDARLNSLTVRFHILKAQIEAILKPIGDAVKGPIMQIFSQLTGFLKANGPEVAQSIATFITEIFKNPKALLLNLMQIKDAGSDFKLAAKVASAFITLKWIFSILSFLGVEFNGGIIATLFGYLYEGFMMLAAIIPWGAAVSFILGMVGTVLTEFLPVFAAAFVLFQGISRGKAQAHLSDASDLAQIAPRITKVSLGWMNIAERLWWPFQWVIQKIADNVEWFFKWSNYVGIFLSASEMMLGPINAFIDIFAEVGGFVAGMLAFRDSIEDMISAWWANNDRIDSVTDSLEELEVYLDPVIKFFEKIPHLFAEIIEWRDKMDAKFFHFMGPAFEKGRNDFLNRGEKNPEKVSGHVYNTTNNVTARFDMKEQLEPDRVAFAVVTHLKKITMNNTQAAGYSVHGGLNNKAAMPQNG